MITKVYCLGNYKLFNYKIRVMLAPKYANEIIFLKFFIRFFSFPLIEVFGGTST